MSEQHLKRVCGICAQEYNVHSNRSTVAVTAGDKAFIHWSVWFLSDIHSHARRMHVSLGIVHRL